MNTAFKEIPKDSQLFAMIRSSWLFIIAIYFCAFLKLLNAKPCNEIIEDVNQNIITLKNVTTFHNHSKNGLEMKKVGAR